ncbi:hypothetical protein [Actinoplanes sp. DH11]|uniref:hypothetical protein n=1 Tax=Actinoplanes sp. DH11 TaxID=2857011 RepID=UPI001E3A1F9F|nr:hypothetical protein [Actinoplanes sp. DH11]
MRDLSQVSARPDPAADLGHADDSTLARLISRGSAAAFAVLVDRTLPAARAELIAAAQAPVPAGKLIAAARPPVPAGEVLAASYLEVWYLAGCHHDAGADVRSWIVGIVRRRLAELARGTPADGLRPGPRPSYAELEVAGPAAPGGRSLPALPAELKGHACSRRGWKAAPARGGAGRPRLLAAGLEGRR